MERQSLSIVVTIFFLLLIACELPVDVDQEPPTINILNLVSGMTVQDSILIQVEVSDNRGVTRVEFWIDSALVNTDNESPWEYIWITIGYEKGSQHSLFIQASDSSGNVGISDKIQLLIESDNTAPVPWITVSPLSGTTSTIFNFDASNSYDDEDSSSVLQVRWDWENDGTWDTDYTFTKTDNHQYTEEGSYTVNMEVKDSEGAIADTAQTIQVEDEIVTTVTDIDGNIYHTVIIGEQVWMSENLKVTHYRDGTAITNVTDDAAWGALTTEAYCIYNNNASGEVDTYGALYNWYAMNDSRNIAPEGWHVPTDAEWKELEMVLGMSQSEVDTEGWRGTNEGSKLAGNAGLWPDGVLESDSEFGTSGFTALPGGYRTSSSGTFASMGSCGYFWSATESGSTVAWGRNLDYGGSAIDRSGSYKSTGFSVRLLRDQPI